MGDLSYPSRREAERMRRWLVTAGASPRLVTAVCASRHLRDQVETELASGGRMRTLAVDITDGDIVPSSFRLYKGSHTAYTLFQFDGLGQRVRRDGVEALLALEREEALFRRPATWACFWIDDPGLPALVARHAPRFHALIELHPTFVSPELQQSSAIGSSRALITELAGRGKPGGSDLAFATGLLLERGDLQGARRLLEARSFDLTSYLLLNADRETLAGDPQAAIALAAAAVATGQQPDEGLARLAELHLALGDHAAARVAAAAIGADGGPGPAVRACLTLAMLVPFDEVTTLAAVTAAAAGDAPSLRRAAMAALPWSAAAIERLLRQARAAAPGDPTMAADLDARLGLLLAGQAESRTAEAGELLHSVSQRDDEAGLRAGRGLARLELAAGLRAVEGGRADDAATAWRAAHARIDAGFERARANGYVAESLDHLWDRTAIAATEEDLPTILAALEELRQLAEAAGLRVIAFNALAEHARALRFGRELALAAGELDTLEALALDLTLPSLERRAFEARAEHLVELGASGEAANALDRANAIAEAVRVG